SHAHEQWGDNPSKSAASPRQFERCNAEVSLLGTTFQVLKTSQEQLVCFLAKTIGRDDKPSDKADQSSQYCCGSQSDRGCVETSGDVIRKTFRTNRGNSSRLFIRPGRSLISLPGSGNRVDASQINNFRSDTTPTL